VPAFSLVRALFRVLALVSIAAAVAACGNLVEAQPTPTPLDFGGITGQLGRAGIGVTNTTSGDAGCADTTLIATAVAFDAIGLDLAAPTRIRVYIFGNRASMERRRADLDRCLQAWATDPATFETVDVSPYVVAGQGPWPPRFKAAISAALREAAGNGG
jgi:hypothetical protein